jgi:hypothetical protein
MIVNKKCSKCFKIKLIEDFSKTKDRKSGVKSQCKSCISKRAKKKVQDNKNYGRTGKRSNKEKLLEGQKRCGCCKVIKNTKDFGRDNYTLDGKKRSCKDCRGKEVNVEKDSERKRKWYFKNEELIKKGLKPKRQKRDRREYLKKHYKENSHMYAWRGLVRRVLKNGEKDKSTLELLGYTYNELKEHISSLFTEGMSWSNHGEWHIDHKKDLALFEKNTPVHIVNALENLQPLWATSRTINGKFYIGNLNKSKFNSHKRFF